MNVLIIWGVGCLAATLGFIVGRAFGKANEGWVVRQMRALNRRIGYQTAIVDLNEMGVHPYICRTLADSLQRRAKLEDWAETFNGTSNGKSV